MDKNDLTRNYDTDPIIIKDYNMLFGLIIEATMIVAMLSAFYIYRDNISSTSLYLYLGVFAPLYIVPGSKRRFKAFGKRYIKLTNTEVIFYEEEKIIQIIKLNNIKYVKRTISDYFHSSQDYTPGYNTIFGFFLTLVIYPCFLITKMIYKLFIIKKRKFMWDDAIIIFDKKNNFVNILPTTDNEYSMVSIYLKDLTNTNIKNTGFYTKLMIDFESINDKENK